MNRKEQTDFTKKGKTNNEKLKWLYEERKKKSTDISEYVLEKEEGIPKNQSNNRKDMSKEEYEEACAGLVDYILAAPLRDTSEEDFYYVIGLAFEELEIIHERVLMKQKKLYYKIKFREMEIDIEESDFDDLIKMREKADKKRVSMVW